MILSRLFLLAAGAVVFAGCGDPGAHLSPNEAVEAAEQIAGDGEPRRALALYRSAAERGHLDAMDALADAHRDGYVRAGMGGKFVPFLPMPWEGERAAERWRQRHERALRDGVRDGDFEAVWQVVQRLRRDDSASAQDSISSLVAPFLAQGDSRAQLAVAMDVYREAPATRDSLLARAEAGGSGQACVLRRILDQTFGFGTVDRLVAYIDAAETCPPIPGQPLTPGQAEIRALRESEVPATRALYDSLRQSGVFQRHPHLRDT